MFMQDATRFDFDAATPVTSQQTGLTAGTLVDTTQGWLAAEGLRIGTGVHTIEGGARPILALDRRVLAVGTLVVRLPGGSFDNCSDLDLLPDQMLVLDDHDGLHLHCAAGTLVGRRGAKFVRLERALECVTPIFAEDEVIWTNSGTRLFCPGLVQAPVIAADPVRYLPEALRRVST